MPFYLDVWQTVAVVARPKDHRQFSARTEAGGVVVVVAVVESLSVRPTV